MWHWVLVVACAGAGADGDSGTPECADLDETSCGATQGCEPVHGRAQCEVGAPTTYAGCRSGAPGCEDVTSCATPPDELGEVWWFPQLCQPDGWTWVGAGDECPSCP